MMGAPLTRREAAIRLHAELLRRGATFTVDDEGYFLCDLNAIRDMNQRDAERIAGAVLELRDELRELLRDRTVH